jgi:hypothetical protein
MAVARRVGSDKFWICHDREPRQTSLQTGIRREGKPASEEHTK